MSVIEANTKSSALLTALSDEIIGSSRIEGVELNPQSVRSSVARKLGIEEDGLLAEDHYVDGLVEVMMDAIHNCMMPVSSERLFDWHVALFPMGRSGMYKIKVASWREGENPMQVVSGAFGHEKVHYEAPPSSAVPEMMRELTEWCNTSVHTPLIKAAIAHLWLVTIHPFDDGNGRISRTLADLFLARMDDSDRYYSMSAEINRNKKSYYDILERTQHGGLDITDWLLWFFSCLEKALRRALDTVDGTVRKSVWWTKFHNVEINERQRKVINRLWDSFEGKLTTSKWAKMCRCSQDTALRDINDLIGKGMLIKSRDGGRSTSYRLKED